MSDRLRFFRLMALIGGIYATVYSVTLSAFDSRLATSVIGGLLLGFFVVTEHRHDDD